MAERSVVASNLGATLSICTTQAAALTTTSVAALTFTAIGNLENIGNHGMTAAVTEFTPIDTGVVAKVKGSKNYGTMTMTGAHIPADTGQDLVLIASELAHDVTFKISYPDGTTPEVHYLTALVSKFEYQNGAVNDVRKLGIDLAVTRAPLITAGVV